MRGIHHAPRGVRIIPLVLSAALFAWLTPMTALGEQSSHTGATASSGPIAMASGHASRAQVVTPHGLSRGVRGIHPFFPTMDRAAYRYMKQHPSDGPARGTASATSSAEPFASANLLVMNTNGTNQANSNGTGASCGCHPPDTDIAVGA